MRNVKQIPPCDLQTQTTSNVTTTSCAKSARLLVITLNLLYFNWALLLGLLLTSPFFLRIHTYCFARSWNFRLQAVRETTLVYFMQLLLLASERFFRSSGYCANTTGAMSLTTMIAIFPERRTNLVTYCTNRFFRRVRYFKSYNLFILSDSHRLSLPSSSTPFHQPTQRVSSKNSRRCVRGDRLLIIRALRSLFGRLRLIKSKF